VGELALRVLGELISGGVFEFLSLSFSCLVCFGFELFFTLFLGLPLFVPFIGLAVFRSSR
jgi:hypothetical protein